MLLQFNDGLLGRGVARCHAAACALAIAAAAIALTTDQARADCNTAVPGGAVTCTATGGPQTTPVGTGSEDNVTVNVQSGATIDVSATPNATAIDLNDQATVTNSGTVIVGSGALGININNSGVVRNYGLVVAGDDSTGINACCNNTVINYGTIAIGSSSGGGTFGIYTNNNSDVANLGTITIGTQAYGIFADGDGSGRARTILNSGTISGAGGFGIGAIDNYTIVNSGTISVGASGIGIQVAGGNAITNSGSINVSLAGFAVYLNGLTGVAGTGNTLLNSGAINADTGMAIFGDSNNTIVNTGTVIGMVLLTGTGNTLTNRGYMVGGSVETFTNPGGAAVGGTLINEASGTLAVRVAPNAPGLPGFPGMAFNDGFVASAITLNGGRLHILVTPGLYENVTVYSSATTNGSPIQTCGCPGGTVITGRFDAVTTSSPFFAATADYSVATEVSVTLTRYGFGAVPGQTPNQRAVGGVLETGYSTGLDPSGTLGRFYSNLLMANSLSVLDQLSGEGTTAAQDASFAAGGQFGNAMLTQGLSWLYGTGTGGVSTIASNYAAEPRNRFAGHEAFAALPTRADAPGRWRAWALGFGGGRWVSGSTGTADRSSQTAGGAIGLDRQIGDGLLLGISAGATGSRFSVSGVSTRGTVDGGHFGAYAVTSFGAPYLAATINYARLDNRTERTIAGIGATENASGRFNADLFGGRVELGWRHRLRDTTVTPFVAIEPTMLRQQAYAETSTTTTGGAGILGLNYAARTTTSLPLSIGLQANTTTSFANGVVFSPSLRAAWVHEFRPQREIEANFISFATPSFTIDGARAARDALRVTAGGTLAVTRAFGLFVSLDGEASGRSTMLSATGGARLSW